MNAQEKPILLVGMMGAGKSTLGPLLAKALGRRFFDVDAEVERIAGKTIPEIFEVYGEGAFRAMENGVLAGLLSHKDTVLAGGGGVMPQKEALNIWLKGDVDTLYNRADAMDRPNKKDLDQFKSVYKERAAGYGLAEIKIDNDHENPDKTLDDIKKALGA